MKTILHIPHSSLILPDEFYEGLLISREKLEEYNLEHTDLYTKELFEYRHYDMIIAPYSRLYCDVERFREDKFESMIQYGQGLLYTHMYDGTLFHTNSEKYKENVLSYYDHHHTILDELTKSALNEHEKLLIIDCHSFKDTVASHYYCGVFPDINLGIEPDFNDERISNLIKQKFQQCGYSVEINYPYQGSLVPNSIYASKNKNVYTIMIEINKRIYLNSDNTINQSKFDFLRAVVLDIYSEISIID